ncbi:MAG: ABC transporter permease [Idiomarina sp.]|nr:ABC transporter permease [Idiomarina sp.]
MLNNTDKVWRVAKFEFLRFFKWKQELLSIGLMVGGMLVAISWGSIMAFFQPEYRIAVMPTQGMAQVPANLPTVTRVEWIRLPGSERERAQQALGDRYDGVMLIDGHDITLLVERRRDWQQNIDSAMADWVRERRISSVNLTPEQHAAVSDPAGIQINVLRTVSGETVVSDEPRERGRSLVSGGILMLLFIGVFSGFGLMMTAITAEKQQRVTEQLLTLMTPQQWMDGKIIGVTLHCIKSMATTGIFVMVLLSVISIVSGRGMFVLPVTFVDVLTLIVFVGFGLILVNSMLAGFAATIDDPNHSSRPLVMFIPLFPVGMSFSVMSTPESAFSTFLSIFPLTSYATMPIRVAETSVPWWQWILAAVLLIATVYYVRRSAANLFNLGITMYGKEPTWKQIWQTAKAL